LFNNYVIGDDSLRTGCITHCATVRKPACFCRT
jgi:hypothetical protein